MVSNRSLFTSKNLLISPDNPCADPPDSEYYSDVNSGTWFKEAKLRECTKPNHILMPFCHFKNSKYSVKLSEKFFGKNWIFNRSTEFTIF